MEDLLGIPPFRLLWNFYLFTVSSSFTSENYSISSWAKQAFEKCSKNKVERSANTVFLVL